MADIKKSPEIVTEQELKPVLENNAFDSTTFLRLYNEWKVTKDQNTFALLRKMHEDAGYNNKNIFFGAEQEMHEIAAIVQKYQDGKIQIVQNTASATAATSASVAPKNKEDAKVSVDEVINSIDMKDIAKMKEGLDKLRLVLNIPMPSPSDKDAILGYTGKLLIARIEQAGYKVYISPDKKIVVESNNRGEDQKTVTALATMLNQDPSNLQVIATGLLYNSSYFPHFVTVNTKTETDGKKTISKPSSDYFADLKNTTRTGNKTKSDEALIQSEAAVRATLGGLTPEKMQSLMTGHMNTGDWLKSNPAVAQQVAQAIVTQTPPNTTTTTASTRPQSSPASTPSRPTTWKENPVGKLFGEAGTSVMNGLGDLLSEPGALSGVFITFIATWIFADFKTALGVLGVATGAAGAYDAYKRHKDGDKKPEEPEAPKKGQKKKPQLKKATEMDHTLDLSKKGPDEKKLWTNLQATPSIKKALNSRKETLGSYMEFIDKNNLLTKTLGDLVYTNSHDASIFSNKTSLPESIQKLPEGIDPIMLKRILRVLISGVDRYSILDRDGVKHTNNYKNWVLGASANSVDDASWKGKKIADIVPDIAKKL